jgi:DNA-binding Lrp family transcriptional regulator
MDVQRQRILDYLIGYWQEQFNLIPAVTVAESLEMSETEVLKLLGDMAQEGSVRIYQPQVGPADPGVLDRSLPETLRSTYVLPSEAILKAHFNEAKQDFGPYKNLLYQGVSQDELFRFRPSILDIYRKNPNIEVNRDLIVTKRGSLLKEGVHPVYVRFRWATGISGDRYIVVNLWDLAELSQDAQALWADHEIRELRETGA